MSQSSSRPTSEEWPRAVALPEPEETEPEYDAPEFTTTEVAALRRRLAERQRQWGNLRFQGATFRTPWPLSRSQYEEYRKKAVNRWLSWMEKDGWDLKSKVHVNGPFPAYGYRGDWQGVPQLDLREFRCAAAFQQMKPKPAGFEVMVRKD